MDKKFVWTEKYSVNVKSIDEQHQHFIDIINDLNDLKNKKDLTKEDALIKVIQLGDYAFYHLDTEEELFKKTGYKDAPLHIEAHNQFRAKSKELILQVRESNEDIKKIIENCALFAGNWLLDHILVMDKEYSNWFNEHGIK